ncbi:MAG: hypothetical protein LBP58_07515 [Azoarcus sp.]|nr:hypothetical protein [Azoarcus sp.]
MRMTNGKYYRTLASGSLLIMGVIFLGFLAHSSSLTGTVAWILIPVTIGIAMGASVPGILLCVVASSCLMGYGLLVRKRHALTLFWSGFILFFLAGLMGWQTRIG